MRLSAGRSVAFDWRFFALIEQSQNACLESVQGNAHRQNLLFLLVFNGTKQFPATQELRTYKRLQIMRDITFFRTMYDSQKGDWR